MTSLRRFVPILFLIVFLCVGSLSVLSHDMDALAKAERRGDADAALQLARIYYDRYETGSAADHLDTYQRLIKRGRKKQADLSGDLSDRIDLMETMLSSVEDIVVIDSLVVDRRLFFERYGLSPEAGYIEPGTSLPGDFPVADTTVVFMPQSGRSMIWGAPVTADGDTVPHTELYGSWRLYGDEWERPVQLGDNLSLGANANWPFMAADGVTLYYASDGEGSLGGYDIYKTQRSDDGFFDPVNVGMPYNSPYDDYMLAIDESLGLGWWATDRNRIPGKLTIYIFKPARVRENISTEDANLPGRARLSSIRDTWREGEDYAGLRAVARADNRGQRHRDADHMVRPEAELTLPDGTVCTSAGDLRGGARGKWPDYVRVARELNGIESELAGLRGRYADGDRSVARDITGLESQLIRSRASLRAIANSIVSANSR